MRATESTSFDTVGETIQINHYEKTSWNGIPTDKLNLEYTSQECPCCGHS